MSKKYRQVMEHVELDDAAKARILKNVSRATADQTEVFTPVRRTLFPWRAVLSVCTVLVLAVMIVPNMPFMQPKELAVSTYGPDEGTTETIVNQPTVGDDYAVNTNGAIDKGVTIANPVSEITSIINLSKAVGFDVVSIQRDLPFIVRSISYYAYEDGIAEVDYDGTYDCATYRQAKKEDGVTDISGVYEDFPDTVTIRVNNINVTLHGEKSSYNLATYSNDEFTYSIYLFTGSPKEEWVTMLSSIAK